MMFKLMTKKLLLQLSHVDQCLGGCIVAQMAEPLVMKGGWPVVRWTVINVCPSSVN